jgi:hypothetical protein
MLFASGLLPILECAQLTPEETVSFLDTRLRLSPTDRLAQSFLDAQAVDEGGRTLGAYDEFIGHMDEEPFRDALESLAREAADGSDEFAEVRRLGKRIQSGLLALLFETDVLPTLVREYAIF